MVLNGRDVGAEVVWDILEVWRTGLTASAGGAYLDMPETEAVVAAAPASWPVLLHFDGQEDNQSVDVFAWRCDHSNTDSLVGSVHLVGSS